MTSLYPQTHTILKPSVTSQPATRTFRGVAFVLFGMIVAFWLGATTQSSSESTITPLAIQLRLDPNVATVDELMLLPRIGPKTAEAIVGFRESHVDGVPFRSAEDLALIEGIGPVTVEKLRQHLQFRKSR